MTVWIVVTVLCCAACIVAAVPLVRRYDRPAAMPAAGDVAILGGQLWRRAVLVCCVGFLAVGGAGYYASMIQPGPGASQTAKISGGADSAVPVPGVGDVDGKIADLAARMQQNPNDAEGWRMLGWSYFNTQRYGEAAGAYARAAALQPENNDFQSSYAEAMVQASGGHVTPDSRKIFESVLLRDSKDLRSRFYIALAHEQAGDLDMALDLWTALAADAPVGAGWVPDVNSRIAGLQARTNGKVPDNSASAQVSAPENPLGLAGKDHQSATAEMIAKLAVRLEASPLDRDGWVMMIRSRSVTGDIAGAREALAKARAIFASDRATVKQIEAVSNSLGVEADQAGEPAAEDDAAVSALPEQDQKAMIRGMVEGLAERLKASPHDAEGWMRLMRSRVVLNEPDLARHALRTALAEFAGDADATVKLSEAARGLGLMFD